ncbi:MAG: hypothetical protein ABS81_05735 [Pseudonocardia sp. SCN 72-86]|nr:MAG: hypothetical protein ABS81_05735 [Pseudonocardia sp. SCN 72-86]
MQLGYVTDDIDAAADHLESTMGTVEVVRHYRSSLGGGAGGESWVVVDGEPADEWVIDVALVSAGSTNVEIIRPVGGAVDLYRGRVRPGVPASLHHLGFVVDDFDEASAVVAAAGRSWAQFGSSGDIRFGYLDLTAELGHFVEVMELGPDSADRFARLEAASNVVRV